jgi:hypothetical protein
MQALVAVVVVGSLYPSWIGNPDARFFLPLMVALIFCGVLYRVLERPNVQADRTE